MSFSIWIRMPSVHFRTASVHFVWDARWTGKARRGVPYTNMLTSPISVIVCDGGESRHESMHPSKQSFCWTHINSFPANIKKKLQASTSIFDHFHISISFLINSWMWVSFITKATFWTKKSSFCKRLNPDWNQNGDENTDECTKLHSHFLFIWLDLYAVECLMIT